MSEIGACFSEPPLRLEGSVGQSGVKHIEDGDGASAVAAATLSEQHVRRRRAHFYVVQVERRPPRRRAQQVAVRSPKLGHHHRRSHDGSYSLPLGCTINISYFTTMGFTFRREKKS